MRELDSVSEQVKVRYNYLHEEILSYILSERGKDIVEEFLNSEDNTDGITVKGYWDKFKELTDDIEYQLNEMEKLYSKARTEVGRIIDSYKENNSQANDVTDIEEITGEIRMFSSSNSINSINRASINDLKIEVTEDSSLSDGGVEIITPPLKYYDFIELIPRFAEDLKDEGFYSDNSCGYHIGISHDSINLHELITNTYKKYMDKGYSALTAYIVATQQGYESVGRYNNPSRGVSNKYAESLIEFIQDKSNKRSESINLENFTLKELLYGGGYKNQLKDLVNNFIREKFTNVNVKHDTHIELRTLGGTAGFGILKDGEKLKKFLYDAISQVFGGTRDLDTQEVTKLVRSVMRNSLNKPTEDSITRIKNKVRQSREQ